MSGGNELNNKSVMVMSGGRTVVSMMAVYPSGGSEGGNDYQTVSACVDKHANMI